MSGLMRKFRVRESEHRIKMPERKVRIYTKGQIVASRFDLTKKFREKFDEVDSKIPETHVEAIREMDRTRVQVMEDAADLGTPTNKAPEEKPEDTEPESKIPDGKDVTAMKYETAEELGLQVFKKEDKSYVLYDAKTDEQTVIPTVVILRNTLSKLSNRK